MASETGPARPSAPASPSAAVGTQNSSSAPLGVGLTDALAPVGGDLRSAACFLLGPADPGPAPLSAGEGAMASETGPARPSAPATTEDDAAAVEAPRTAARDLSSANTSDTASVDSADGLPQDPLAKADDI
jgi:hypothetical protein